MFIFIIIDKWRHVAGNVICGSTDMSDSTEREHFVHGGNILLNRLFNRWLDRGGPVQNTQEPACVRKDFLQDEGKWVPPLMGCKPDQNKVFQSPIPENKRTKQHLWTGKNQVYLFPTPRQIHGHKTYSTVWVGGQRWGGICECWLGKGKLYWQVAQFVLFLILILSQWHAERAVVAERE